MQPLDAAGSPLYCAANYFSPWKAIMYEGDLYVVWWQMTPANDIVHYKSMVTPCPYMSLRNTRPRENLSLYRICRNKRLGCLIFRCNKKDLKTHQKPSVLCAPPPCEKSPIKSPSVLCTPPFEKSLFLVGAYFGVGVYFGKYGTWFRSDKVGIEFWVYSR